MAASFPIVVNYCGEYCAFGPSPNKCEKWLIENNAELHGLYYGQTEDLEGKVKELSLTEEKKGKKKEAKKQNVLVKRVDRNKKKHITVISGLDVFGVDLKKTAKKFASKFACGCSVTKNEAQNSDEITVQGDFVDEVIEMILKDFPQITSDQVEKKIVVKKKKEGEEEEPENE